MRRRLRTAAAALGLMLLWAHSASAKYRGTDIMDNIGPGSAFDGMADKYPLSHYGLDYHVAGPSAGLGGVDAGDIPQLIAQAFTAMIWNVLALMLRIVIDVFAWAFSLDLIGGAHGALRPIGDAVRGIYEGLGGETWLVAAVVIAGCWALWKGLVQQRYTETVGGLAVSVVILVIALLCIYQPQQTIGQASSWTNDLSGAFLAAGSGHSPDQPTDAKRGVVAHLRETLIYKPWVVLEFGGLRHCVNENDRDDDGFPRPVSAKDPRRTTCRDHIKRGADGHGGYAPRWLKYAPGTSERNAEYEALKDGKAPERDPQFAGYPVDRADAPAVDVQQAGGAYQRLALVSLIGIGVIGIVALLVQLSAIVILAQVAALALLAFAPVALVLGVIPGRGHAIFKWWGTQLLTALFIKALFALVLGVLVLISAALTVAAASMGFLFAFGLQAAFFWLVLIFRKRITHKLVEASVGRYDKHERVGRYARHAGGITERPFSALAGMGGAAVGAAAGAVKCRKQESAPGDVPDAETTGPEQEEPERRYTMAETSTSGSREYQEGEPRKLDGRDSRFDAAPERPREPQPSGLVSGALDPGKPLSRDSARADMEDAAPESVAAPVEPRHTESAIRPEFEPPEPERQKDET